jgi:uncharacterized protein YndB with AHSA1/START domain
MMNHAMTESSFDLSFRRHLDVSKELIWRAWTEPELLKIWFCPRPWKTVHCEIDLRAGGIFKTIMQSPQGDLFPNEGCFLEIEKNKQLVWTNSLLPGFRPNQVANLGQEDNAFFFTATIHLEDRVGGTTYTASVKHADEASCNKHKAMGFEQGWGIALDQLIEMLRQGI